MRMSWKCSFKNDNQPTHSYHLDKIEQPLGPPQHLHLALAHKIVSPGLWSYKRKYNIYGLEAAQFINIASLCPVRRKSAGRWNRFKVVVGSCACAFSFCTRSYSRFHFDSVGEARGRRGRFILWECFEGNGDLVLTRGGFRMIPNRSKKRKWNRKHCQHKKCF